MSLLHFNMVAYSIIWCSVASVQSSNSTTTPTLNFASKLVVEQGSLTQVLGNKASIFTKFVRVFDLFFVATAKSPDNKLLHGATILYQYLDNNDTGTPDNNAVYRELKKEKATMVMFESQKEMESYARQGLPDNVLIQDLQADETRPGSLRRESFDASLEECFHLVYQGYKLAYPGVFGTQRGSQISVLMDRARGGYFDQIPQKYPSGAWYTYYDATCDYQCQVDEYIYWVLTTMLHAQMLRCEEIAHEWKPCTRDSLRRIDNQSIVLLSDPVYKFPTTLPRPIKKVIEANKRSSSPVISHCIAIVFFQCLITIGLNHICW